MATKFLHDVETNAVLLKAFCNGSMLKEFEMLDANQGEGAAEKHLPVFEREGDTIRVKVGEAEHPMDPDHFIAFILLETEKMDQVVRLKPGEKPEATFVVAPGDTAIAVYEYCNKHGLYKTMIEE